MKDVVLVFYSVEIELRNSLRSDLNIAGKPLNNKYL